MENSTFSGHLEKSLPENHASVLFCHFGIHSSRHLINYPSVYVDCTRPLRPKNGLPINLDLSPNSGDETGPEIKLLGFRALIVKSNSDLS